MNRTYEEIERAALDAAVNESNKQRRQLLAKKTVGGETTSENQSFDLT